MDKDPRARHRPVKTPLTLSTPRGRSSPSPNLPNPHLPLVGASVVTGSPSDVADPVGATSPIGSTHVGSAAGVPPRRRGHRKRLNRPPTNGHLLNMQIIVRNPR
jgi:hypothetical protein